jgi:hypothetical protein
MPDNIISIPIAKGGKNATLDVDMSTIPDAVYATIIQEGLKVLLNAKMAKVGAVTKLEGPDLQKANAEAMSIAAKNLADLQAGKSTKGRAKAEKSDLPREVQTESMRIARNIVKDLIRAAKGYPSQYAASEITAMAKQVIENDASIVEQAKDNLAKRKATESNMAIDILSLGKPDPKKVEAAAKKNAEKRTQLSATQAGKTAPPPRRTRGDVAPSVVH